MIEANITIMSLAGLPLSCHVVDYKVEQLITSHKKPQWDLNYYEAVHFEFMDLFTPISLEPVN